ncbi:VOC family protein [Panacibacter ginsenosidivorans]|uniref:VOC family protein n=1 Tax=Panacibacter ginsenosidivorans TaxID=1813871 RepID=A0A5B8V7B2_9BACT|nr:VOC family protein [Panacibacter ginsenosidivorans]QEC66576.1 VOC family protein [Panacibacter ginsenosidivorans]
MKSIIRLTGLLLLFTINITNIEAQVKEVGPIGITVKDMNTSVKFYSEVLGFKKISDKEVYGSQYEQLEGIFGLRMRIVRMQLGDEVIELTDYLTSGGRSIPEDMRSNDLYFEHIAIVVSDMENAYRHLRKYMVMHVSTAPQTIPANNVAAAGVKAFYFHDPDMHDLELIYFPKGKGQAKWQNTNGKLFLGIDHTALGISNTDSSLYFYKNILGLDRKGDSWNMGMEQAHLNNIEGASLHITGLHALSGVGIEFLQYLKPGPGKPFPADTRADDIWHWQTTLIADDVTSLYNKLKKLNYSFVSKGVVEMKDKDGDMYKAFIVRDPDGHAMLVRE